MKKQYLFFSFILMSSLSVFAQPANDACNNAILMACGDVQTGSTATATIDTAPICSPALDITAPGVWYTFVGTGDDVTASLCDVATNYDTKIIVYSGTCGTLVCEAGNDDAQGACGLQSVTSFSTAIGTDYYILVTGFGTGTGNFALTLTCAAPCSPIVTNDDCATAEMISLAADPASCVPTTGTTSCAQVNLTNPSCNQFGSTNDVWYQFNSGTNGSVEIDLDTLSSLNNLSFAVYDVCGGTNIACGPINHNVNSQLTGLSAGTVYYIQIWNSGASGAGSFSLCIMDGQPAPPAPANDDCANSTVLIEGTTCVYTPGSVVSATQSLAPNTCNNFTSATANDVWYSFVATNPITTVIVDPMFDPVVELMDDCTGQNIIGCSDEVGTVTEVIESTGLIIGNTYYIRVFPFGASPIDPTFNICVQEGAFVSLTEESEVQFRVYPNPTNGVLNFEYANISSGTILFVNNVGQIAKKTSLVETVDVSDLNKGIYHIRIFDNNGVVIGNEKVVVN